MNNLFANKFKNIYPTSKNNIISNDNTLNSSSYSSEKNKQKKEYPFEKKRDRAKDKDLNKYKE